MELLKKLYFVFRAPVRFNHFQGLDKPAGHPHLILGFLCLILLVSILASLPSLDANQPAYLTTHPPALFAPAGPASSTDLGGINPSRNIPDIGMPLTGR